MEEYIYMTVENQRFKVIDYHHRTYQEIDENGQQRQRASGGIVFVTVEFDGNPTLHHWALSDALTKDVVIKIPSRHGDVKSIEIILEKTLCLSVDDRINTLNVNDYTRSVKLSAAEMYISGEQLYESQ